MPTNLLALDVGAARIGVAVANTVARIAAPLPAIVNDDQVLAQLRSLIDEYSIDRLVVGWPRGLEGQETPQTAAVDDFIGRLASFGLPITRQDEALTSRQAEAELRARGKDYSKGDVDSLSAVYILEDYLANEVH